jgi:hypothetical protein
LSRFDHDWLQPPATLRVSVPAYSAHRRQTQSGGGNEIAAKVSPIKSHLFFLKGDKVVMVDPKDNRVVEVID